MIGCDSGYLSAFLDQNVARAMYPDIWVATGAAATPTGKASRVPGGYRVEGRFPFVSGCHHSEWVWLGCIVHEGDAPRADAKGVPETRQCFLRVSQCEILDTWYTMGLRGTGSNDILVRNVFVPEEQTFSFQDPALVKRPGPLHAFPYWTGCGARHCPPCDRRADRERNDKTCPPLYARRWSRGAQSAA
jgi:hypothetical protein